MGDIKFKASKHLSPLLHQGNLSSQNLACFPLVHILV